MTDINECDESNGGCSHNCNNTEGSFECSCRDGYMLDSNGAICSGIACVYQLTLFVQPSSQDCVQIKSCISVNKMNSNLILDKLDSVYYTLFRLTLRINNCNISFVENIMQITILPCYKNTLFRFI